MNSKLLLILVLGIILGAGIFAVAFYFGMQSKKENLSPTFPTPSSFKSSATNSPAPTLEPTSSNGIIEGSISYPSEGIPDDLEVCAETLQGTLVKCTKTHIPDAKYQYGVGYNLELPLGTYYIYAITEQGNKAYYTEFVTCGLLYSCTSHQKIAVEVAANKTQNKIDPGDWYNN